MSLNDDLTRLGERSCELGFLEAKTAMLELLTALIPTAATPDELDLLKAFSTGVQGLTLGERTS